MPGLSQSSAVRSKLPWELLEEIPRLGTVTWLLALGLAGAARAGELPRRVLVLLGTYQASPLAAAGLVPAAVYSLWLVQRVLQGPRPEERSHGDRLGDLSAREVAIAISLAAPLVGLGLYPRPVIETARPAISSILELAAQESTRMTAEDLLPLAPLVAMAAAAGSPSPSRDGFFAPTGSRTTGPASP